MTSICYLGSIATEDRRSEEEIRSRIGMAKSRFYDNAKILTGNISIDTKKRLIKSLVWSVALYAAETWTMRKEDIKRVQAFEMLFWRKTLKISYTKHITNGQVLTKIKEKRSMLPRIIGQQKLWIGHNLRHSENLLTIAIEREAEEEKSACSLIY